MSEQAWVVYGPSMKSPLDVYLRRDGKSNIHLSDADKFASPEEAFNALMEYLQNHDIVDRIGDFRILYAYKVWQTAGIKCEK